MLTESILSLKVIEDLIIVYITPINNINDNNDSEGSYYNTPNTLATIDEDKSDNLDKNKNDIDETALLSDLLVKVNKDNRRFNAIRVV